MTTKEKKYNTIAVVGPTASGKSSLAIDLAKIFKGEIINADSRQVYKYMNIGTAKDPDDNPNGNVYTVEGIRHHLIDFLEPSEKYSVADFQKRAVEKIKEITERGNIPFLVGGTGLWIDAVCKNDYQFEHIEPDWELRKELEQKSIEELFDQLSNLDKKTANDLNNSDSKNPVRLIRLIEKKLLKENSAKVSFPTQSGIHTLNIKAIYLSPKVEFKQLEEKIYTRVDKMIKMGLIEEIKGLLKKGFSFQDPGMSGIGYKEFDGYFDGFKTIEEVLNDIKIHTRQYAKRQVTWFKRNKDINYVNFEEAKTIVKKFLN